MDPAARPAKKKTSTYLKRNVPEKCKQKTATAEREGVG